MVKKNFLVIHVIHIKQLSPHRNVFSFVFFLNQKVFSDSKIFFDQKFAFEHKLYLYLYPKISFQHKVFAPENVLSELSILFLSKFIPALLIVNCLQLKCYFKQLILDLKFYLIQIISMGLLLLQSGAFVHSDTFPRWWGGWVGQFKIKDHLSPAEAEIGAELDNN